MNRSVQEMQELRDMVEVAVKVDGCVSPPEIIAYLQDNGWEYDYPSKPTIIDLLRQNGVEYIQGYWTKTR